MTQEQLKNFELDNRIRGVLLSDDSLIVPPGLTETVIRKLEKKVLLRQLIVELFLKLGLVVFSLTILTGVFIGIKGFGVLAILFTYFNTYRQLITSLLLVGLVIILIDQVGLRFYNSLKKEASLGV
jgi:hypothetical protein